MIRTLILATAVALASVRGVDAQAAPAGYAVRKAIALAPDDGVAGRLELLEDARITPALRPPLDRGGMEVSCAEPDTPALRAVCASARRTPFRRAVVRLVSDGGRVLSSRTLERELGDVGVRHLYGGARRTYFVTSDLSIGMGSYAGPLTRLAEVHGGRLRWLRATDVRTGRGEEIHLVATLKTAWEVVPRRGATGREILLLMCRPNGNAAARDTATAHDFVLTFERYAFERGAWRVHRRTEPGCWEDESPFPPRRRFP